MPSPCAARHCNNSRRQGYSHISFPRDQHLKEEWLNNAGLKSVRPSDRLCEVHFKREDWITFGLKLKRDAIPSLFCTCNHCVATRPTDHSYSSTTRIIRLSKEVFHDHSYSSASSTRPSNPYTHTPACLLRAVQKSEDRGKDQENVLKTHISALEDKLSEARKVFVSQGKVLQELQAQNDQTQWLRQKFGEDQMKAAETGNSRGRKWGLESVKKALNIQCAGNTKGLEAASEELMPLPSARTIQRHISCIKFEPGLLTEILGPFQRKVESSFADTDRDCGIFFDEMAIKMRLDFDKATQRYIGAVSLPGHTPSTTLASKMEVFMLGGIRSRWKLNAAYHFTPSSECAEPVKQVLSDLLNYANSCNLNVISVVCDMGNRGALSNLGFNFTKYDMKYCIPNPVQPSKPLYIVPDVVHLLKSVKEMLVNNEELHLSEAIVTKYHLPSSTVKLSHIEWLIHYQDDMEVKFAPRLKAKAVSSTHFSKMDTASACHVFHDKTARAIEFLVSKNQFPKEFETTAFFIDVMNKWFNLLTSRTKATALSLHDRHAYDKAISHLHLVIDVFLTMSVADAWKPAQTHVVMATRAILDIQHHLLFERGYQYVLLSRFLNDLVENCFSQVRSVRPTPSALEAKYRLKRITLTQCSRKVFKSQYGHDERVSVLELEDILKFIESSPPRIAIEDDSLLMWSFPADVFSVGFKYQNLVTYRMCGYLLHTMRSNHQLNCDECFRMLQQQGTPLPLAEWTVKTDFKENAQIQISEELWLLLGSIEHNLLRWQSVFIKLNNIIKTVEKSVIPMLDYYEVSFCPGCTDLNLKKKIVSRFLEMRVKQLSTHCAENKTRSNAGYQLASWSMGARLLANNFVLRKTEERKKKRAQKKAETQQKRAETLKRKAMAQNNIVPKPPVVDKSLVTVSPAPTGKSVSLLNFKPKVAGKSIGHIRIIRMPR